MCRDTWVDMCIDMCTDTCIRMCIDRCTDACIDMCIDMYIDTCIDICADLYGLHHLCTTPLFKGDQPCGLQPSSLDTADTDCLH